VAVSVVERLEIVRVEEHERGPLLSGEGRKARNSRSSASPVRRSTLQS
jgi:hypothetical protein